MLKPYDLLENLLLDIENGIKNNINVSVLSKKYGFSEGHLSRLFRFAFKQSIAAYIRSRTLAVSLNDILETNTKIVDIAVEYGFEYEQSYIRTFKREFGITPGDLRKTRKIIQIKPPLHLFNEKRVDGGVLFGPDFVMVPRFQIIGKCHHISFEDPMDTESLLAKQFWENERKQIKETVNSNVYIGLTRNINWKKKYIEYTSSVQVKKLKSIPHGLCGCTFETSMCARFRYIGQHHNDINGNVVSMMYNDINKFAHNEQAKNLLLRQRIHFEMVDTRFYDENYCQIEWYTPVSEKQ